MDKLYMILLCLMIVPILICIKYSRKIKSDVASSIVKCLIFAIVTILSNGLSTFSGNETFSYIMEALYRFSFDLMLIYVLQYSQQYTRVFTRFHRLKGVFHNCISGWNFTVFKYNFS